MKFGDAEAISFHATKTLHAVEGGAVITDNDAIADQCRLIRNFGIAGLTQIDALGTNGKMNELCAAAGLTGLENIDSVLETNNRNLDSYRSVVNAIPGLQTAIPHSQHPINAQYVVVTVNEDEYGLSRDRLIEVLHAERVFARAYFAPGCQNAPPYAGQPVHTPTSLAVTEQLLSSVMQLPTGTAVCAAEIERIGALLLDIHQHRDSLNHRSTITTERRSDAA